MAFKPEAQHQQEHQYCRYQQLQLHMLIAMPAAPTACRQSAHTHAIGKHGLQTHPQLATKAAAAGASTAKHQSKTCAQHHLPHLHTLNTSKPCLNSATPDTSQPQHKHAAHIALPAALARR